MVSGKVALVTGSSRGIGAATAKRLAQHGAAVAVNCRSNREAGERVVSEIREVGGRAALFQADVTQPAAVTTLVAAVVAELGPVDLLVNNANVSFPTEPFIEYRWAAFEKKLLGELSAAFHCCQAVVPGMVARGGGSIINVSSGLSRSPGPGFVAHTTAKSGLDGFSKALALELGRHQIRVNVVAPGLTDTDAVAHLPEAARQATAQRTPLGRIAQPDDVAGAILFLCSDEARFVTGAYISTAGGALMI